MNDKEHTVMRMEYDVRLQKIRVLEAKKAMETGYAKLTAEFERDYAKLKGDFERECIILEREESWLLKAKADLERGYGA